jgi:hypothetical protein
VKFFKYILPLFVFLSSETFSQETRADTLQSLIKHPEALQNIQFRFEEFEVYRERYYSDFHIPLDEDKATIQLRTEMIIRQSVGQGYFTTDESFYFLSPLYNKYIEESKFNPVKYVLGIAQLSAVGYLAYRHIKKYGFID